MRRAIFRTRGKCTRMRASRSSASKPVTQLLSDTLRERIGGIFTERRSFGEWLERVLEDQCFHRDLYLGPQRAIHVANCWRYAASRLPLARLWRLLRRLAERRGSASSTPQSKRWSVRACRTSLSDSPRHPASPDALDPIPASDERPCRRRSSNVLPKGTWQAPIAR